LPTALGLLHLGSHGSVVGLIIFEALLSPVLIDAAQRWPPKKNSNRQRRGGAALKNKSTGVPGWCLLLIYNPAADDYSIIACRIIEASSAHHTMTKGGLSPDYERTKLIWPSGT
jgi:hypothetical protein